MNLEENQRGFLNGQFKDNYNNECSIQKSSSAMEDCIWLGIDKPKLVVFEDDSMINRVCCYKMSIEFLYRQQGN